MYPHERSLVKQLSNNKFALIGVNSDKDLAELKKVVREKNITWRSFLNGKDPADSISQSWNVSGWPTIYVIDAKGMIRYHNVRGEALDQAIESLLGEMGETVSIKHDEEAEREKPG